MVTVSQLADYWGKHAYTLTAYIRKGRLVARLVGGEYRIALRDALAFERADQAWRKRGA